MAGHKEIARISVFVVRKIGTMTMVWFCQFHIAVLINSFRNLRTPRYSYLCALFRGSLSLAEGRAIIVGSLLIPLKIHATPNILIGACFFGGRFCSQSGGPLLLLVAGVAVALAIALSVEVARGGRNRGRGG